MSHGDFLSDFGRKSGVFGKKIWRKLGVSILSYLAVLLICLDFLYLKFIFISIKQKPAKNYLYSVVVELSSRAGPFHDLWQRIIKW